MAGVLQPAQKDGIGASPESLLLESLKPSSCAARSWRNPVVGKGGLKFVLLHKLMFTCRVIQYRTGNGIDLDVVIELYRASTLAERRPVEDRGRMASMLREANLVITAWDGQLLVGLARSFTDFAFCTYLSDLAVRVSHQRQGIGRELIRRTQQVGGQATVILLAAPKAAEYYPRIGFTHHPQAWTLGSQDPLK